MLCLSTEKRRCITQCNVNYTSEGIYHPDRVMEVYDFLYMKAGSWDIWEEETCYHLEKNHLLILEPGHHHYSLLKCTPHMQNLYIHCTALPGDGMDTTENIHLSKITDCTGSPQIEQLFLQIIETYWSRPQHCEFRLGALFDVLLTELALCADSSDTPDPLIREILHHFYSDPSRFFSPQELADLYQISVRSLSGRFRKVTGTSIHQYQLTLKLNLAREQLRLYPGRRLRDIALGLGFYDEFHFSRLFRRQFGYPPSRREHL